MTRCIRKDWDLARKYVLTSGRRAYLIGTQSGGFPVLGDHVPGEMGGLWVHPIKLADGFWLRVDGQWLPPATAVEVAPATVCHTFQAGPVTLLRRQWVPDDLPALVLGLDLSGTPGKHTLELLVRSDLRPVWLGEREGLAATPNQALAVRGGALVMAYGQPWALAVLGQVAVNPGAADGSIGSSASVPQVNPAAGPGPEPVQGDTGAWVSLTWDFAIPYDGATTLYVALAGGVDGPDAALAAAREALTDPAGKLRQREEGLGALLARSHAELPDPDLCHAFDWSKVNLEWLAREVPGLGTGIGAGVPEYPWFFGCDTAYTVPALLGVGQFELAADSLRLLAKITAERGERGRIIHEATTLGSVYNPGNVQESPQYVWAVAQTLRWTGDKALAAELLPTCVDAMAWVESRPRLAGLPLGYGIIEEEGLDVACIDVATWTATGWLALAELHQAVGDEESARQAREKGQALWERTHQLFWLAEEGLYGDVLATPAQFIPQLEQWRDEAPQRGERHVVEHLEILIQRAQALPPDEPAVFLLGHWIILTPLEVGLAPAECAARSLERLTSWEFCGRHGMYLTRFRRTHAMSINTGALAVAACRYGRPDLALRLMGQVASTLRTHMPGALPEMLPDYGCFVQAWSAHALVTPLLQHFFGLQPDAVRHHVTWRPQAPAGWRGRIERVRVGDAEFAVVAEPGDTSICCSAAGWQVTIVAPDGHAAEASLAPGEPFHAALD